VLILHVVHGSRDIVALFGHWLRSAEFGLTGSAQQLRSWPFDHADLNARAGDCSLHRGDPGPVSTSRRICREVRFYSRRGRIRLPMSK
jgi:hypothetical protein